MAEVLGMALACGKLACSELCDMMDRYGVFTTVPNLRAFNRTVQVLPAQQDMLQTALLTGTSMTTALLIQLHALQSTGPLVRLVLTLAACENKLCVGRQGITLNDDKCDRADLVWGTLASYQLRLRQGKRSLKT